MKIIGLAASPRLGGNTEILLDAFLDGAKSAGAEVEKRQLVKADIRPCIGCEKCFDTGDCQFSDDAPAMYDPLLKADVVVMATPVYFYSTTTFAKLLIDRCQALWARRHVLKRKDYIPGGRGVLISAGGTKGKALFEGVRLSTKYFLETLGKELSACLYFRGINDKKEILNNPEAIDRARELGRKIASEPNYIDTKGCTNG